MSFLTLIQVPNALHGAARLGRISALGGLLMLAAGGAAAQAFDTVRLYGAAPGQDGGSAGLVLIHGSRYAGSDQTRTMLVPSIDYQWANGFFAGVSNGLGYNFSRQPSTQYGLRLTADFGRKESRATALRGMGDVDAAAQLGAFFNFAPSRELFFSSSLRYGSGNDKNGALLDLGVGSAHVLAPQWRLGLGLGATLTNAAYQQSYFGVTAAQALRSGYAVYTPGAGLRDLRANAALTYAINPQMSLTTAVSVSSLVGDAKDSPLTRKATAASVVVAFGYGF